MKRYIKNDFIRIRDFLIDTYAKFQRPVNWTIERWNFSISVARIMNGMEMDEWESQIGIWEHDQEILAIVNTEGEREGEAFFQLGTYDVPDALIQEMFSFTESHLGVIQDNKKIIYLRISPFFPRIEAFAVDRGFTKLDKSSPIAELILNEEYSVTLPRNFHFVYGDAINSEDKGMVHAKAFGYADEDIYTKRSAVAFQEMRTTPDYRPEYDIHILSPEDEIAAFATLWYDKRNQIGILEPVVTIPKYRKMGLGRANIMQLANQLRQAGGARLYVGSEQDFYIRVGFHAYKKYGIWKKVIES
jgi:hypothetical protein